MSAHRPNRMKRVADGRGGELIPRLLARPGCGALVAALPASRPAPAWSRGGKNNRYLRRPEEMNDRVARAT